MNLHTVAAHMKARKWSRAELARRAGVSRQAVTLWFKQEHASVRSDHLLRLSRELGKPAESLARPLPGFGQDHDRLRAELLWDGLYPDLDDFAIAVNRWELPAIGRLVQVRGLYVAERLLGRAVWKRFDTYKRYIHPVRRKELEALVTWHNNPTAG